MQKKKAIIFLILAVAVSGLSIAGNLAGWFANANVDNELPGAKEEYQRICDRIKNDSSISLDASITLYDGEAPDEIKEQTTCRYIRRQDKYYSQFSYLQVFCNGKLVVQLDTVNQVIVVSPVATEHKRVKGPMRQLTFDMLFNEQADFRIAGKVIQKNDNEREISCQSDFNPEIKTFDITYDPATYQVKRATIQWWKEGVAAETAAASQVWISHIDYRQLPAVNMDIEEEISKIITIKKDQIEPALKYQDYQLHVSNPEQ
ncbi:hypothetical protein FAM09_09165 [Niastella caeni]|uniref:DUF4292 domain-containing protein n=1 Tax=Niastella caeni TaxID=2569763 RepID=A0A4S8HX39_9BACT|nr:hypothetical protein [Niastella caeni]THU40045.1 hypothetical protein FAM09_09165 [Niastella caeni]